MGNCTCSTEKEQNETHDDEGNYDIALRDIMDEILSDPRRLLFADSVSELEDNFDYDDEDGGDDVSDIVHDISFENGSDISKLEKVFFEDELCGICAFNFDDDQHVPRILPCGHTLCYYCIRKMARRYKFKYLKCPLDRQRHVLKQQHKDQILTGGQSSSTISIESGDDDLVLSLDLFRQSNFDRGIDEQFRDIDNDTSMNGGSVINFVNLNLLPLNYSQSSGSQVNDQLSTKSLDTTSRYAVQDSNIEPGNTDSDDSDCTINIYQQHSKRERSWCEVHEDSEIENIDVVREFSDIDDFRCKLRPETIDDVSITERDDMYADERSVRSYEWLEPDYD